MNIEYFNRIVSTYGIGVDEFLDRFASQKHQCKICHRDLVLFSSSKVEAPVVDHDHDTGAVRGILCHTCNIAVGYLEKDKARTFRCLRYIFRNEKKQSGKLLLFFKRYMKEKTG